MAALSGCDRPLAIGGMTPSVSDATMSLARIAARAVRFGARSVAGSWHSLQRASNSAAPLGAGCAAPANGVVRAIAAAAAAADFHNADVMIFPGVPDFSASIDTR